MRRWVCGVVAHAKVLFLKVHEEICEQDVHHECGADKSEDEKKAHLLLRDLVDFHRRIGCAGVAERWRRMGWHVMFRRKKTRWGMIQGLVCEFAHGDGRDDVGNSGQEEVSSD